MNKIRFTEQSDGFCGCFSGTTGKQEAAIILMNDDGPDDFLSKVGVKWLNHHLAEEKHPLTEAIMIPIERIQGRLLLAGAEDDVVWDTCRAIRRMQKRLEETGSGCRCEALIYQHCSHFIFPESLLRLFLPAFVVDWILPLVFRETRGYVRECRESRIDLDRHIRGMIREWTAG